MIEDEPVEMELPLPVRRGKLRFLIGLQRSGKSTWATQWMRCGSREDEDGVTYPRAVVCADSIRLALAGQRYNRRIEPATFMIKGYMVDALLERGHDVLCDGTHSTPTSIRRILEIEPHAQWTLINTPPDVCKQRAIETGQDDLLPVIDRCYQQLQKLLAEGIDNVITRLLREINERRGH